MRPSEILERLDSEQREAVTAPIGPVRIIAGAGTGKTRTLIHRIAYWDAMGIAPADKTLVVTHSNKSAAELRTRLKSIGVKQSHAQTFHREAMTQLESNWASIPAYWRIWGYQSTYPTLITDNSKDREINQYWIIRRITEGILKQHDLLSGTKRIFDKELNQAINSEITLLRARMINVDMYEKDKQTPDKIGSLSKKEFVSLLKKYKKFKVARNLIDFADILDLCIGMVEDNHAIAEQIQSKYEHFLVDEYQDSDPVQERLLKAWLGGRSSICVVGDPRQTIYSFKGADPKILTSFADRHKNCHTIELVKNYRSTPEIVTLANRLMKNTPASGGAISSLTSEQSSGSLPIITSYPDEIQEQIGVANSIQNIVLGQKIEFKEIAILLRLNSSVPLFQLALRKIGIPNKSPGDTFWEDVLPIMKNLQSVALTRHAESGITVLADVLEKSGWTQDISAGGKIDKQSIERRNNAESLLALAEFLEESEKSNPKALVLAFARLRDESKEENDLDAVIVTTIHKAKGLEWDAVVLPRFVHGTIPISLAKEIDEIYEERRLAYVAITRARKHLLITWSLTSDSFGRLKHQIRSGFIGYMEEPKPTVDLTSPKKTYSPSPASVKSVNKITLREPLKVGNRVNYFRYGLGTVVKIDGESVEIDFGILGIKKFKHSNPGLEKL
jgi:DNA helicase II / ATP-dependent DNA helicase PcrA